MLGKGAGLTEHKQFEQALPLYVTGWLSADVRQDIDAHLQSGCHDCQKLLQDFKETLSLLPFELSPAPVPPELTARILSNLPESATIPDQIEEEATSFGSDSEEELPTASSPRRTPYGVIMVLVLLLVGVSMYALSLRSQLARETAEGKQLSQALDETTIQLSLLRQQVTNQQEMVEELKARQAKVLERVPTEPSAGSPGHESTNALQEQLVKREGELAQLQRLVQQQESILKILQAPGVDAVMLQGGKTSSAAALLLLDPQEQRGLLYAFNLTPLTPDKTYQLWALAGKSISLGIFDLDAGQKGRLLLKNLMNLPQGTRFAVSVEKKGGESKLTGTIRLIGQK